MSHPQVVLGLDFGGTKIAAAVCDLAGNKLASAVVSSRAELGAKASFAHGIATARELLARRPRTAASWSRSAPPPSASRSRTGSSWPRRSRAGRRWRSAGSWRAAFPGAAVSMATDAKAAARAEVALGLAGGL